MDFWARQAEARQRSRWLVVVFIAAVLSVVLAVNVVVLTLLAFSDRGEIVATTWVREHPAAVVISTLTVLSIIGVASVSKTMSLGGGGGVVARSLGGMRVPTATQDPLRRRLLNVVEEIAIASGVAVPAVYVLEEEDGINALSAGHTTANAAIAVTRGTLEQLNREELEGVIGHEFSHILNGDMRLNMRLIGMIFGLMVIATTGRAIARRSGRGGLLLVAGLATLGIGYIGAFFGRFIQAAVSRQREFLADASSVQFTRNSTGLRNALVKIGSVSGSRLRHAEADQVAHMLFAPGMTRWFATHPPLVERIRALDPSFDPAEFKNLRLEVKPQPLGVVQVVAGQQLPSAFSDPAALRRRSVRLDPRSVPVLVANPGIAEMDHAQALRQSLPEAPSAGIEGSNWAAALLFALVLDSRSSIRTLQVQKVRSAFGAGIEEQLRAQAAHVDSLRPEQRLPVLARIVPELQHLSRHTRLHILECLSALCRTDGQITIFEYALATLARVYLEEGLEPRWKARPVRLDDATVELQTVFGTLAAHGHADETAAKHAFEDGVSRLNLARPLQFDSVPGWVGALDHALRCLDGLPPPEKARLVEGLAATVVRDGQVTIAEAELLRAICGVLRCPLPPLLDHGDPLM